MYIYIFIYLYFLLHFYGMNLTLLRSWTEVRHIIVLLPLLEIYIITLPREKLNSDKPLMALSD